MRRVLVCSLFLVLFFGSGYASAFSQRSAAVPALAAAPDRAPTRAAATSPAVDAAPKAAKHPARNSKPHVYLLRGFMNIFSRGMDALADKLQRRGILATVGNHSEAGTLAEEAIRNCLSGKETSIMLVGHSLGADAIVDMANRMSQAGVKVSLVATVDPVLHPIVHGNVRRVVNYYLSNGMGSAVAKENGFRGNLQNVDLKDHTELGHSSLVMADIVQHKLLNDIAGAMHSSCR